MRAETGTLILSLDTASERRSAAVVRGGEVLSLVTAETRASAGGALTEVDAALRRAGVEVGAVELFAVASGPGSFTGLRSGLATVKALAQTLSRPAVGVPTLHALAHAARPAEKFVAVIPAGRGEVFAQFLSAGEEGVRELGRPAHLKPSALLEKALDSGGGLKWGGAGAHLLAVEIRARAEGAGIPFVKLSTAGEAAPEGAWALSPPVDVLAPHVAGLGLALFRSGGFVEPGRLQALYVRASDAELKERCLKHEGPPSGASNSSSGR